MCHHEIALANDSFDLDVQLRELFGESLDELHERIGSVWGLRVVLNVFRAHVLATASSGFLSLKASV